MRRERGAWATRGAWPGGGLVDWPIAAGWRQSPFIFDGGPSPTPKTWVVNDDDDDDGLYRCLSVSILCLLYSWLWAGRDSLWWGVGCVCRLTGEDRRRDNDQWGCGVREIWHIREESDFRSRYGHSGRFRGAWKEEMKNDRAVGRNSQEPEAWYRHPPGLIANHDCSNEPIHFKTSLQTLETNYSNFKGLIPNFMGPSSVIRPFTGTTMKLGSSGPDATKGQFFG